MANSNTPITASATNTQAEDTVQNPVRTNTGEANVYLTLQFSGVDVDPNAIYDMVNGTYGTVATIKESVARNTYIFKIEA